MEWELSVPSPTSLVWLIDALWACHSENSPFQPCSLCKQSEITSRDVVTLRNEQPIHFAHLHEDATSHSTKGGMGVGEEGREGGK